EHVGWLCERIRRGDRVACAADMLSLASERSLRERLARRDAQLVEDDLPARIWSDRPALPRSPIHEHAAAFAIRTRVEKLEAARKTMRESGATHHLVSALDEIAWVLNLRGSDVEYNPVFLAHLLIDSGEAALFVDASRIDAELQQALRADGVRLAPYGSIGAALGGLPEDTRLLLAPAQVSATIAHAIPAGVTLIESPGPIAGAKARKSEAELALVRGARWIEETLARGERITELDVDEKLRELRSRQPGFVSESFATIAGYGANAALPHYRATRESHAELKPRGMLLVDSGAQYL